MRPSDRKSREKSSKDGKKRKAAPMDATARKVKRARQDGVPDQYQYDQLPLEISLLDQQTWQRSHENGVPDEALMNMDRPDWGLPDELNQRIGVFPSRETGRLHVEMVCPWMSTNTIKRTVIFLKCF